MYQLVKTCKSLLRTKRVFPISSFSVRRRIWTESSKLLWWEAFYPEDPWWKSHTWMETYFQYFCTCPIVKEGRTNLVFEVNSYREMLDIHQTTKRKFLDHEDEVEVILLNRGVKRQHYDWTIGDIRLENAPKQLVCPIWISRGKVEYKTCHRSTEESNLILINGEEGKAQNAFLVNYLISAHET